MEKQMVMRKGSEVIQRQTTQSCDKPSRVVQDEKGQAAVWLVILLPVLLALVGLVFDGGMLYAQYRRGRWAADGAAVAAANAIDPVRYAESGQVKLDAGLVYGTARKYAQDNDPALSVSGVSIVGNAVQVRSTLTIRPSFLSLFGVGPVTLKITGQERPAWGISQQGQ
jgi:Flp pilus assembly protein TadG